MSSFINLLDVVYPIGCYYISADNTSPSTLFGGTWTCVNSHFYPETLLSDSVVQNIDDNYEWNKKVRRNGVAFMSTASMGQKALPTAAYWDIMKLTEANGYKSMLKIPTFQHAIGGTQSDWSGYVGKGAENDSSVQAYGIYAKAGNPRYWAVGAVYPTDITGTRSYIWKRTA